MTKWPVGPGMVEDMAKRITLESFVANLRADIGAFETMWRAERAKNPKDWPATQPTMENWQEQFIAWYEPRDTERTPAESSFS